MFDAEIFLIPTNQNGRTGYFKSGNSGTFWLGHYHGDEKMFNDACITFQAQDRLYPGESAIATLEPLSEEYWRKVQVGDRFEMHDWSKVVGHAKILRVYGEMVNIVDKGGPPDD